MDDLYLVISTILFLGGFLSAAISVRSGKKLPKGLNIGIAAVGFVFQCLFLRERGELHGKCPITNGAEVLVFVCWSIVLMYLALGKAFRLSLLGAFSLPMVFLLQVVALIYLSIADPGAKPVEVLDPWLELHAAMSLLAYGAFGLSAIAGLMYIIQDRLMKKHETGRLFFSMPPLRYLLLALIRLLVIGWALLTIGIVAAFFMEELPGALHFAVSGAVWVVYVILLLAVWLRRPSPRNLSLLSMGAFVFALLTLSAL